MNQGECHHEYVRTGSAMSSDEAKCLKQVNTGTGSTNCQLEKGHGGYCSQHAIAMRMTPRPDGAEPALREQIEKLFEAYQALKRLGWNDIIYCPKDGTWFDAIEVGSTGIHTCRYEGEWPTGSWWISDENDLSPARPVLFRKREAVLASSQRAPEGQP